MKLDSRYTSQKRIHCQAIVHCPALFLSGVVTCVCVCVYVCVCVCVRPFTVKASSLWISWSTKEQINDVVLKTYISYAKPLQRYFRMKHLTFLTSHFSLFTHQKRAKPQLNQYASCFQNMVPSATITCIAFGPQYIVSRPASGLYTHERGRNLTRKGQSNCSPQY